jgi:hypothetical protein
MTQLLKNEADFNLNLVVALGAEAQALIKQFKLKPCCSSPFRVYQGLFVFGKKQELAANIQLIVSGSGAVRSASAVAWLAARQTLTEDKGLPSQNANTFWINIGTAGARTLEVGTACWINAYKGLDTAERQVPLLAKWRGSRQGNSSIMPIETVTKPTSVYPESHVIDMEAIGFFESARQFAPLEYVQALKIISDNQHSSIERLNKNVIEELMNDVNEVLQAFIESQLMTIVPINVYSPEAGEVVAKLHQRFQALSPSVTQLRQFEDVSQKLSSFERSDLTTGMLAVFDDVLKELSTDAQSHSNTKAYVKEILLELQALLSKQTLLIE